MSWLERMGLVEREEPAFLVEDVVTEPEVEVDADIDSTVDVVNEIYAQNGMSDRNNSIYTVQALIDTLPEEMTTAKKQNTVSGILMVSGKTVSSLLNDAGSRIDTLCAARDKIVSEYTAEINAANADIEELKKAIEAANIRIKNSEDIIAETTKSVDAEIKAIDNLVEFCNGMEAKQ